MQKINAQCLNCGKGIESDVLTDSLGAHALCPKCVSSFDVDDSKMVQINRRSRYDLSD